MHYIFFTNNEAAYGGIGLRGEVDVMLYDKSGQVNDEWHLDNLFVGVGVEGIAYKIAPFTGSVALSTPYNYVALGTGNMPVGS